MWLTLLALLAVSAGADLPRPRPVSPVDGVWRLVRLERGGQELPVGNPRLTVQSNRLRLSLPPSADVELLLAPDHRVLRWAPTAGRPAVLWCPFTPKEWAKRFGQPLPTCGPDQWVIDPVNGLSTLVPPMPCQHLPPVPPSPGPEVGLYVSTGDQLMIQLSPTSPEDGLVLVLRRAADRP